MHGRSGVSAAMKTSGCPDISDVRNRIRLDELDSLLLPSRPRRQKYRFFRIRAISPARSSSAQAFPQRYPFGLCQSELAGNIDLVKRPVIFPP